MPADHALARGPKRTRDAGIATLPAELSELVGRCVRASGTRGRDALSVERELVAHLRDELDAGRTVAEIVAEFGDPEVSGLLIGRARSRLRRSRAMSAMRRSALGMAAAMACLYLASAVRLHSRTPDHWVTPVERVPAILRKPTGLDPRAASRLVDTLLARMYTDGGDNRGRLTARGLRIVQRLKGVDTPSLAALVAEPAYFAFPATRRGVRREADRVLRLAERARLDGQSSDAWREFEREVARFDWSRPGAYRYVPLAIVLPRLAAAMRTAEVAQPPRVMSSRPQ